MKTEKSVPIWAWIVMGVLAFVIIILFIELSYNSLKEETELKIAELNDEVKTGNLLFTLNNAQLDTTDTDSHILFLDFIVTNVGENIENVSDCGVLLFENGLQYEFRLEPNWVNIKEDCNYYDMVPGSKIMIEPIFYFVDSSRGGSFWKEYHISWDKVPGSKITYFSQQSNELIKVVINKSEIIST